MIPFNDVFDRMKKDNTTCKGLYFRYRENVYYNQDQNSIEFKKSLRLLKSISCLKCDKCLNMLEVINEEITNAEENVLQNMKHEGIYYPKIIWIPGPYDSPNDGDLELEFIKHTTNNIKEILEGQKNNE